MPKAKRTTKAGIKKKQKTFTSLISVFENEVTLHAFKCNKEVAKAYTNEAKQVIESQRYKWTPLSPKYKDWKLKKGYDPRIYIRTGEFLDSIMWGVTHKKVWMGIPSRKMHTGKLLRADDPDEKPKPMRLLARWLEYGVPKSPPKTVPPRPIWRPLLAKYIRLKPDFGKRYRKALLQAVNRRTKNKR